MGDLCSQFGVQGYPTIKYGDPNNLEDYDGERSYAELKEFANKNLGPVCGPNNMDLCNAEMKAKIAEFMAMSEADLAAAIKEKDDTVKKADDDLEELLKDLQEKFESATKEKDEKVKAIKDSGLSIMKKVLASQKKTEL